MVDAGPSSTQGPKRLGKTLNLASGEGCTLMVEQKRAAPIVSSGNLSPPSSNASMWWSKIFGLGGIYSGAAFMIVFLIMGVGSHAPALQ